MRSTQFLQRNLELLGFGNARDALVQCVKEVFENAMDAVLASDSAREMLRIRVRNDAQRPQWIEIECTDTGSGIRTHEITQLCCGAFATTKASRRSPDDTPTKAAPTSGKYGVGLKAAMLYSQQHDQNACLSITTTASSSEILYLQLRINADSEEPAVVQSLQQFIVDEQHRRFSGTEMRLSVPCPEKETDLEHAVDTLALYFQSLRYTAPPFVGVEFCFDVNSIRLDVLCAHEEQAIDRFVADLGASVQDIVYEQSIKGPSCTVNCMALLLGDEESTEIELCLLRYGNHIPLLQADDFLLCGIATGIVNPRVWKRIGFQCRRSLDSNAMITQFVVSPPGRTHGSGDAKPRRRLVMAVDVSINDSVNQDTTLKYRSLRKTSLDPSYSHAVQSCCQAVLKQFVERGLLRTPQQIRDQDIVSLYAPLIANAAASIANLAHIRHSQNSGLDHEDSADAIEVDDVTDQLQRVISVAMM